MINVSTILSERMPRGCHSSLYLSTYSPALGAIIACQASNSIFRLDLEKASLERMDIDLDLVGDLVSIHGWDHHGSSYLAGASCSGSVDDNEVTSSVFVLRFHFREGNLVIDMSATQHVDYVPFVVMSLPRILQNGDDPFLVVTGSNGGVHLLTCSTLENATDAWFPSDRFHEVSSSILSIDCISHNERAVIAAGSNDGNIFVCEGVPTKADFLWSSLGAFLLDGPFPAVQLTIINGFVSLVAVAALGGAFMFHDVYRGLHADKDSLSLLAESDTSDCLTSACFDSFGEFLLIGSWIQEILVYECSEGSNAAPAYVGRLQFNNPVYNMTWSSDNRLLLVFTMKELVAFSRDSILSFIKTNKAVR